MWLKFQFLTVIISVHIVLLWQEGLAVVYQVLLLCHVGIPSRVLRMNDVFVPTHRGLVLFFLSLWPSYIKEVCNTIP